MSSGDRPRARIEGGCLCGKVRYLSDAAPLNVAHCHCGMCRKASGAPVVTWISLPRSGVRLTAGEAVTRRSSAQAERSFCPDCGTQLTFWSERYPDDLDVTLGSLDRPEDFPAEYHIWTSAKLPWLHLDPELPAWRAFSDSGPPETAG